MPTTKTIAKGTYTETCLENGFYVLVSKNENTFTEVIERQIDSSYIQFHFCINGSASFLFNNGSYTLNTEADTMLLLYNPQRHLPMYLELHPNAVMVSVIISIKKLHVLFSSDANYIGFLSDDNKDQKYYSDNKISASMAVVLNQLLSFNLNSTVKPLYYKAKIYELLSLYFNKNESSDIEHCPYLANEDNVAKLKKAKAIIIAQMAEPPSLQELSETIGLSLKKLKEGFKQVYGDTVYGFLLNHKMEVARQLLESGQHNVNEVGLKVGYSTASHFIAAFKKKFGTTPKKYLQSYVN